MTVSVSEPATSSRTSSLCSEHSTHCAALGSTSSSSNTREAKPLLTHLRGCTRLAKKPASARSTVQGLALKRNLPQTNASRSLFSNDIYNGSTYIARRSLGTRPTANRNAAAQATLSTSIPYILPWEDTAVYASTPTCVDDTTSHPNS